jgi:putative transposase
VTTTVCEAPVVNQGYRFRLDPTSSQAQALASHVGGARFAFNHMLRLVKAELDQRTAERSYGITDPELTTATGWSMYALRKQWNTRKGDYAPWWEQNSKEAYASGLLALSQGLKNWSASRQGKRAGPSMGFPRLKRHGQKVGVRFTTGVIRVESDRHHVSLPRLGTIHTLESTRKLALRIENGRARILSATVTCDVRGHWFVSFTVEVQRAVGRVAIPAHRPAGKYPVLGVDVGVKVDALLVAATPAGEEVLRVPAPRVLMNSQTQLRSLGRKAAKRQGRYDPVTKRRQVPSNRWRKTQARIAKAHLKAANTRKDVLHKATTELAQVADVIVIEDLNVAGMSRRKPGAGKGGKGLNRAIADASLATIHQMLVYKTNWYGSQLETVDRWYPSSKTCSGCRTVKTKLSLAERTYECEHCGLQIDRDLNAAINLAQTHETMGVPPLANARRGRVSTESASVAGRGGSQKTDATQVATADTYETSTLHPNRGSDRERLPRKRKAA